MFPDDSKGGELSTNPYTYGDWMDPNVGYVRNRFTVFNIAVYNYTYAKMQLEPLKVILLTDRGGYLESYTIAPVADRKSLEGYYRGLRGHQRERALSLFQTDRDRARDRLWRRRGDFQRGRTTAGLSCSIPSIPRWATCV